MTEIRIEMCNKESCAPTTQRDGNADYERIIVILDDLIEREIWCGCKWNKKNYDKARLE